MPEYYTEKNLKTDHFLILFLALIIYAIVNYALSLLSQYQFCVGGTLAGAAYGVTFPTGRIGRYGPYLFVWSRWNTCRSCVCI